MRQFGFNWRMRGWTAWLGLGATLLAAGCTTVDQPLQADLSSQSTEIRACAAWFVALDDAVDRAGVRDAEAHPIPGYPHLRANRFLASFRQQAGHDPAAFAAWEQHLRALDARSRGYELQNLPAAELATLGVSNRNDAAAKTDRCAGQLVALDAADAGRRAALVERAVVPDDYADWKRALGLYPLVRMPFLAFAKAGEQESAMQFQATAAGSERGAPAVRYQPSAAPAPASAIAALLASARKDALGIPEIDKPERETLFASFAPVYEVETTASYDRFGPLVWGTGEPPGVDAARPTAYRRLAFTRYGGRVLVQLVYTVWFSERPDESWLDPSSGKLDGLIFRVTLDPTGRPLVYDSIHPCGCYHTFLPTSLARVKPAPDPDEEWAFVPRPAPDVAPPERVLLRVASRNHYLIDIRRDAGGQGAAYALADEAELRTLPTAEGTRSAFGPTGIVPGTERLERVVVWTLGVEEPGAMREWGRHATAMIGRRHFDDADLLEQRFEFRLP